MVFPEKSSDLNEDWRAALYGLHLWHKGALGQTQVSLDQIYSRWQERGEIDAIDIAYLMAVLSDPHGIYIGRDDDARLWRIAEDLTACELPKLKAAIRYWVAAALRINEGHATINACVREAMGRQNPLTLLFDINVRRGMAALHWARVQQQKDVLPYLRVHTSGTCECGLQAGWIVKMDHPFWDYAQPPNGPVCTCGFTQVSKRMMTKNGWRITPSSQLFQMDALSEGFRGGLSLP